MRRVLARMMDRVGRRNPGLLVPVHSTGIHVPVEPGEVAARDLDSHPMAGQKHVARGLEVDLDLVPTPRLHEYRVRISVPIPGPLNALLEVERLPVRLNVEQLDREISVLR